MNVTLSADKRVIEKARAYAATHGTSLNQLIRDYLERLVGEPTAEEAAEEFARIAREHPGDSRGGTTGGREGIYEDRMRALMHADLVSDEHRGGSHE